MTPIRRLLVAVAFAFVLTAAGAAPSYAVPADASDCVALLDEPEIMAIPADAIDGPEYLQSLDWTCAVTSTFDDGSGLTPAGTGRFYFLFGADYADLLDLMRAAGDDPLVVPGEVQSADGESYSPLSVSEYETIDDATTAVVSMNLPEGFDGPPFYGLLAVYASAASEIGPRTRALPGSAAVTNDESSFLMVAYWVNDPVVVDTHGWEEPSILSGLKTVGEAVPNPFQLGVVALLTAALLASVAYPGFVLGAVVSRRYEELVAPRTRRLVDKLETTSARRRWIVGTGVAAAACILCFLEPDVGFNPLTLRLLLCSLVALVLFNIGGALVVAQVVRRIAPGSEPRVRLRWGSLVILALAVVACRALEFEPGVVFGLVAGAVFVTLTTSQGAVAALAGLGYSAAAGIVFWIVYSAMNLLPESGPALFVSETTGALAIEGISTLPLALLPIAALEGATVRRWSARVWGATFSVATALALIVLVTVPRSWDQAPGDLVRWVIILIAFSVLAIGCVHLDGWLRRRASRE